MHPGLDDFDSSSFDLEGNAADDCTDVVPTATEGLQVQICNPWDSMLRWYDCLAIAPLTAKPSGESPSGSAAANDFVFSR